MPKRKGKIPRITVCAVKPFSLSDENWQKVDAAYGQSIPSEARSQIELATTAFLRVANAEKNTGLMDDALRRASHLRECASQLIDAIGDRPIGDVIRGYVDEALADEYWRLKVTKKFAKHLPTHPYVSWVSLELGRFMNACDNMIDLAPRYDFWADGGAWKRWIRRLSTIFDAHGLQTGARKDTTKNKANKASPFVEFVYSLQELLPSEYIRSQHSRGALATAIGKARGGSKAPAKKKKAPARSPGRKASTS
jgi:hypothetical protein